MATDRRKFLKILGVGAVASAFPASIKRALAIPAHHRTGTIADVDHIVILMQENRSFDHYFGTLRGVRGFGDPRAVRLPSGDPVWSQPNGATPRAAVPPGRAQPRAPVSRGPAPRLDGHPSGLERGQVRSVGAEQGHDDDGAPDTRRHTVSLRAGRRVHRLRRVSLFVSGRDRPQSLPHVDGVGRQRRQGRRPGARQLRGGLRLVDFPRAPAESGNLLEDLSGRGRRPRCGRTSGAGATTRTSATTATIRSSTFTSIRARNRAVRSTRER